MARYFTAFYSDPHFGHKNIIEYSARPFSSLKEMDEKLVENYNKYISPVDVVLWLGDCFFSKPEVAEFTLSQMNGTKILVRGNHDRSATWMSEIGFAAVADELTLCIAGHKCVARHHPKRERDAVVLHGHVHSRKRRENNMVHCGVDAWDYRPAMFDEVAALVKEVYGY